MKEKLNAWLGFIIIACVALLSLGINSLISFVPTKQISEIDASISSSSNTELHYNGTFYTPNQKTTSHQRPDYSNCIYVGASLGEDGNWTSASNAGSYRLYKDNVTITSGNFTGTRKLIKSVTSCPMCGSKSVNFTQYSISTSLYFSVNQYGNYQINVYDSTGSYKGTDSLDHFYHGTINFDARGGTGGSTSEVITSNVVSKITIPTRNGYTFLGYFTDITGGTKMYSENGDAVYLPINYPNNINASTLQLYAQWAEKYTTVSVDPNGGSWNGTSSSQTFAQEPGTNKSLSIPTREGYTFGGWVMQSGDAAISSFGKLKWQDGFFDEGGQPGLSVYNNLYNGNVLLTYESPDTWLNLPGQKYILKISNIGPANPNLGGYYSYIMSEANHVYYQIIYAKLPIGYALDWHTNEIGNESKIEWLTDTNGTGCYEKYVLKRKCGSTGTFSNTGHISLKGDKEGTIEDPVNWCIAYQGTYDAFGLSVTENLGGAATITFGTESSQVRAIWLEDTWARYAQEPSQAANGWYEVKNAQELAYFARKTMSEISEDRIRLMNNIDMAGHYWRPIGSGYAFRFEGDMEGQGYSIYNLNTMPDQDFQGLFGYCYAKQYVQNIMIASGWIQGKTNVGGICGVLLTSTVRNCISQAKVTGETNVGGLIGEALNYATVSNCFVAAEVKGKTSVGGLIGFANVPMETKGYVRVNQCYGNVSVTGGERVGGIIGYAKAYSSVMQDCAIIGNLDITSSTATYVGGLVGQVVNQNVTQATHSIRDCSFNGSIDGVVVKAIMGLYGFYQGNIYACYAVCNNNRIMAGPDFSHWSYCEGLNDGLPIQNELFAVAGFNTYDVHGYLLNLGFREV